MSTQKGFALPILILIILLPVVGFLLGQQQFKLKTDKSNSDLLSDESFKQLKIANKEFSDRIRQLETLSNFSSYTKNADSLAFKCFNPNDLPQTDKILHIKQSLQSENRDIFRLCQNSLNEDYIVATSPRGSNTPPYTYNLEVRKYHFYKDDYNSTYQLYDSSDSEKSSDDFKLVDWLQNGDVVFTILSWQPNRIKTFVNSSNTQESQLIEYCNWGIGPGTSARYFTSCKTILTESNSKYNKTNDLP
jgi:hypothetical protein